MTVKHTAFRLTPEDLSILDDVQARTGIRSKTEALRLCLRAAVQPPGERPLSHPGGKRRLGKSQD